MDIKTYVSVENLLQNKQGKGNASGVPDNMSFKRYKKDDILIGNIRLYLKKIWLAGYSGGTNGDVLVIRKKAGYNNVVIAKYLYYVLSSDSFFNFAVSHSKGAKMPRGDKRAIMHYSLRIPSIERQRQIVSILDHFDKICNDITKGLPAEIEARQKQYEYYRDKLLTFKELNNECIK